jgi:hypothetical protein
MVAEKIYDLLPQKWPLVLGDLPATADVVVGIIEYDGATSTEYFGGGDRYAYNETPKSIFNPIVKIVIRHESYSEGQTWAEEVKNTLHRYYDEYTGILSILMVGTPMYLGRNEQKLHEFQVTFNITVKE